MKTRRLALKLFSGSPSIATATGAVFAMLDEPGVVDAHGDTMDAGALELPEPGSDGLRKVPLYYLHSYHESVVQEASPSERVAIGEAVVWVENGFPYFTPRFYGNTELSDETKARMEAGEIDRCSVGYLVKEATPNGKGPGGSGEDVHSARLIEVSLVEQGAKDGAVRVKTMKLEDMRQVAAALVTARAEVKALKTKSLGVEMMCNSRSLYFATELMEHCAEAIAACQSFLKDAKEYAPGKEPLLTDVATTSITAFGQALAQLGTWIASPEARGETAAPPAQDEAKAEVDPKEPVDAVTKFLNSFRAKAA